MAKKMFVSFILDETGSMLSVKGQTISGFNEYVETLQREENAGRIRFALTKFNSEKIEVVHDGVKLAEVEALTGDSYRPNYVTPLYDAIGTTIRALETRLEGKKRNVLVVIQTDGQENDSKEFTLRGIFDLISDKKAAGWTFVFLGADQDAWVAGHVLGIEKGNVMSYAGEQTVGTFKKTARATTRYTQSGGTQTAKFFGDMSMSGDEGDDETTVQANLRRREWVKISERER